MKTLLQIVLVPFLLFAFNANSQNGIRVPKKQNLILNVHLDYPKTLNPTKKERGLNYVIEAGVATYIPNLIGFEAKLNYESFPSLFGGYDSYGAAVGIKLVSGYNEEFSYYIGFRGNKVYRTSERLGKAYRVNPGFEAQINYSLSDNFYTGLRYTLDKAYDQEIFDWEVKNRWAVYLTIGFRILKI